jgi:hypothetical protein
MALCSGIRADGGRCQAQAMRGEEHCVSHHPDYAETRRARNSKGGKRGGRGRPQVEMRDIKALLEDLTDRILEGELPTNAAAVANQLINTRLRAIETERKIKETEELEERIEALEKLQPRSNAKGARQWHR